MKRTTVYLDSDLEVRLKAEARRRRRPMAELIREALEEYLAPSSPRLPPGVGDFDSGHRDTAERSEEILSETGFGAE